MKHSKKIFAMLMTLALCVGVAACGSPAGNTGGNSAQTASAAEDSSDEAVSEEVSETAADETEDMTSDQTNETLKAVNVGVIAWSTGRGDEAEFIESVQTTLSEHYSDQIGDVFVGDAMQDAAQLSLIMDNMKVMWEGENIVVLIVNDEDGFSDEELLSVLQDADQAGIIAGVDHAIDGAPESAFVYDVSDAAGCAAAIVENAAGM